MSTATLDERIADLEQHETEFGLGSTGKKRLAALEEAREIGRREELTNFNLLRDELAAASTAHEAALAAAIDAFDVYVSARETLGPLTLRIDSLRSRGYKAELPETPAPDSFGHRALRDPAVRQLRDRSLVLGSW